MLYIVCDGHTSIQYYNPTIHVFVKSEEVRHPCAFHVFKIILNLQIYMGAWAWNVEIMT